MKRVGVKALAMLVTLAIVFSVVLAVTAAAQAENVVTGFSSNSEFYSQLEVRDLEGVVYRADEEFDTLKTVFDAELSNISFTCREGSLRFSALLNYDGNQHEVIAKGLLYPLRGGGFYDDKLVVAELHSQNEFKIVQFIIRNEQMARVTISIAIENTKTGDLVYFQGSINRSDFHKILEGANRRLEIAKQRNGFDEEELQLKTLQLLNINNHLVYTRKSHDPGKTLEIYTEGIVETFKGETGGISILATAAVGYHDLNNLFTDLKSFGSVNLLNYNVPESIFKGAGWDQYHNVSTHPRFFYVRYGAVQIGYTLTQITFMDIKQGPVTGEPHMYFVQHNIKHGMITEYCHSTHQLTVLFYDFGLRFRNWEQIITRLTGRNVFVSREINGHLLETPSFWRAAIALVPILDTAYGVWEHIAQRGTHPLGIRIEFDQTYEEQLARHVDRVIRGIVGDFSDFTFRNEGHFASTRGGIYMPDPLSLTWSYRGNAYHNL